MTIAALPAPPNSSNPTAFAGAMDAFLAALPAFVTQANALGAAIDASAISCLANAIAAQIAGATAWVSGTTYAIGDPRYSLVNFLSYRRKTVGAGTTDPSADPTNWAQVSISPGANTFSGNQNYSDYQNSRAMFIDCGFTVLDKGNSGTTTQTFDYTAGSVQTWTATGNHTIATSNWPPTGNLGELLLIGTNLGAFTLTWPTINWLKPDGTTTTSLATYLAANTGRTALQSSGVDQILLWSRDGGTTIYGKLV